MRMKIAAVVERGACSLSHPQPQLLPVGTAVHKLESTGVDVRQTEPRHPGAHPQRVGQLEVAVVMAWLVLDRDLQRTRHIIAVRHVENVATDPYLRACTSHMCH